MKHKGVFVNKPVETEKLIGLISRSQASVAVRLHMLVFSALAGVPAIGIEYDPKVSSFQEYIGQSYCLKPEDILNESYKKVIDSFMSEIDSTKAIIESTLPK